MWDMDNIFIFDSRIVLIGESLYFFVLYFRPLFINNKYVELTEQDPEVSSQKWRGEGVWYDPKYVTSKT